MADDDGDTDPTGDRVWRGDQPSEAEHVKRLTDDLARERFARRTIDQALLDVIEERDRVLAQLVEAMATGQSMEGQCNDLAAERDRLQRAFNMDDLNALHGCPDCGLHRACGEVVAERDRLRVVVDAVRGYVALDPADDEAGLLAAFQDIRRIIAELLDVSPAMGDEPYRPLKEACPECEGTGCTTCSGKGWRINPDFGTPDTGTPPPGQPWKTFDHRTPAMGEADQVIGVVPHHHGAPGSANPGAPSETPAMGGSEKEDA